MVGIICSGAYIPLYRLGKDTKGWGRSTEKAVANFDEDSITMAVAAAIDCLDRIDRSSIDALYLASTTLPYSEKSNAGIVAAATDLRRDILVADFSSSLRSGTIALRAATDAVKAGAVERVLVVASDHRVPRPASEFEPIFGDGAAVFIVGRSDVAASIEDCYSISDQIYDVWRLEGERFARSWEDRFILEEGYLKVLPESVLPLMKRNNLTAKDFSKAVFNAPDARRHAQMARILGFNSQNQVQEPMFTTVGSTGAAFALMILAAALEEAKAGDRLILANYGDGADAFILKVTDSIGQSRKYKHGVKGYLDSRKTLNDYQRYLRWHGLAQIAGGGRRPPLATPSVSALWRERNLALRFRGVRCKACGTLQLPPQRVCTNCHSQDNFESIRFSDKKAKLFTFTMDYVTPRPDPPEVVGLIDFEDGGRVLLSMTDREVDEIEIGMPLEMSFRKLYEAGGIENYYWKCIPLR